MYKITCTLMVLIVSGAFSGCGGGSGAPSNTSISSNSGGSASEATSLAGLAQATSRSRNVYSITIQGSYYDTYLQEALTLPKQMGYLYITSQVAQNPLEVLIACNPGYVSGGTNVGSIQSGYLLFATNTALYRADTRIPWLSYNFSPFSLADVTVNNTAAILDANPNSGSQTASNLNIFAGYGTGSLLSINPNYILVSSRQISTEYPAGVHLSFQGKSVSGSMSLYGVLQPSAGASELPGTPAYYLVQVTGQYVTQESW